MNRPLRLLLVVVVLVAVLSPRAHAQGLHAEIQRVLDGLDVPTAAVSVWAQPLDADAPAIAVNVDVPRNPASAMKLVTSYAALEILNPAYRWKTEVYALGELERGVLDGDLLVKGYGDPFLVIEEYWKLWRELRRRGLTRIRGDLLFDVSHYALEPEDPGAFDGRPDRVYNQRPHPLLVNFNAVRFGFEPGAGGRVHVTQDPQLPNLELDNRLRLGGPRCGGYQRGVALAVLGDGQRDRVQLDGEFPNGCSYHEMTRTVLQPETYAFGLFQQHWASLGGRHDGGWRHAELPDDALLVMTHYSRPLGELVRLVNKYSNNVMTRHLKLELGAKVFGTPATTANGNEAIRMLLEDQGVTTDGLVLDNAAGLSRDVRISARTMAEMLLAARRSPFLPEFQSSMSLAGLDGTMRRRFANSSQAGRMHLKTGRLNDVAAVAGYVKAASGRDWLVVAFINAPDAHRGPGEEIQDAVLEWVYRQ